jgi:hypothetical protein
VACGVGHADNVSLDDGSHLVSRIRAKDFRRQSHSSRSSRTALRSARLGQSTAKPGARLARSPARAACGCALDATLAFGSVVTTEKRPSCRTHAMRKMRCPASRNATCGRRPRPARGAVRAGARGAGLGPPLKERAHGYDAAPMLDGPRPHAASVRRLAQRRLDAGVEHRAPALCGGGKAPRQLRGGKRAVVLWERRAGTCEPGYASWHHDGGVAPWHVRMARYLHVLEDPPAARAEAGVTSGGTWRTYLPSPASAAPCVIRAALCVLAGSALALDARDGTAQTGGALLATLAGVAADALERATLHQRHSLRGAVRGGLQVRAQRPAS